MNPAFLPAGLRDAYSTATGCFVAAVRLLENAKANDHQNLVDSYSDLAEKIRLAKQAVQSLPQPLAHDSNLINACELAMKVALAYCECEPNGPGVRVLIGNVNPIHPNQKKYLDDARKRLRAISLPKWSKLNDLIIAELDKQVRGVNSETSQVPADRRTKPLSITEAGVLMGLVSSTGPKTKRRDNARNSMKRMMDSGGIAFEKMGSKYVFDKSKFPPDSRNKL